MAPEASARATSKPCSSPWNASRSGAATCSSTAAGDARASGEAPALPHAGQGGPTTMSQQQGTERSGTYLTPEADEHLTSELQVLKTEGRERISQAIGAAREHGDIRENADYDAAKNEQGLMEARIRQLEALLSSAVVGEGPDGAGEGAPPGPVRGTARQAWQPPGRLTASTCGNRAPEPALVRMNEVSARPVGELEEDAVEDVGLAGDHLREAETADEPVEQQGAGGDHVLPARGHHRQGGALGDGHDGQLLGGGGDGARVHRGQVDPAGGVGGQAQGDRPHRGGPARPP